MTPRPLLFAVALVVAATNAGAAVYYVAPSGDDSSPGSIARPWRTLAKAANAVLPGDTVYFRAGVYNERLIPGRSGAEGAPITFAAYPGESAVIDGTGIPFPTDAGLVDLSQQYFLRVSGLAVRNASGAAIFADTSGNLVIDNCSVHTAGGSGIGIWNSHDVVADRNEIVAVCTLGMQENITIANTTAFEVKNNHVHHTAPGNEGKEGICVKDGAANGSVHDNHVHDVSFVGIYVDGSFRGVSDVEIAANRVHDVAGSHGGIGISVASEAGGLNRNSTVVNNLVYDCLYAGMTVSACCPEYAPHHPIRGTVLINNTVVHNGRGPWGGGLTVEATEIDGIVVRNNLVSDNLSFQLAADPVAPPSKLTIDHNLIDGFRGTENEVTGADAVQGAALLVNAAAGDLHLQANSPAIDRGSAEGAPNCDFANGRRPVDGNRDGIAAVDIGAYEWYAAAKRRAVAR